MSTQDAANCERLAAALVELRAQVYPYRTEPIPITPQLLSTHRIINFGTPARRVDLLAEVPGLGRYEDLASGAVKLDLGSLSVPALTLDQLIQAKSVLSRPKDREHLDQLLAVRRLREPG